MLRRAALVLANVVPLVPVQAVFAGIIGGASALTLAVVALGARARVPRTAAALAASPGV